MRGTIIAILVLQFLINLAFVVVGIGMAIYLPEHLHLPPMVMAIIIIYGPTIFAGYLGGGQFIRTQMRAMRMSEAIRCALLVATIGLLIPVAAGLLAGVVKNGSAHLDRTIAVFQHAVSTISDWIIPFLTTIATNAGLLLIGLLLRNRRARR